MKNLKIGSKFIVTFGIIIAMSIFTVILSLFGLNSTGSNFDSFYSNGFQITNQGKDMLRAIQAGAKYIGYTSMETDSAKTETYINSAIEEFNSLRDGLKFMRENFRGDQALVDQCEKWLDEGLPYRNEVFEYSRNNENDKASQLYFEKYNPILLNVQGNLTKIYDEALQNANNNYASAKSAKNAVTIILFTASLILIVTTVTLAVYLTRSLNSPIREIESAARELVSGNLNAMITYTSRDELGNLSESIRGLIGNIKGIIQDVGHTLSELGQGNFTVESEARHLYVGDFESLLNSITTIVEQLTDTMTQINQASDQVASGSDQVSSGAQALSQGATEQASSVEELAATINEISQQVKRNADNAQSAREQSEQTAVEVTGSNQQMQQMIAAMNDINSKSSEISKIIKTIEDIAFQTNILALNAAVEAARAGAAGKGFAVVADEVRNLAGKSADAAKSTTALIEETVSAVENGMNIAGETAKAMQSVVDGTTTVTNFIVEIAGASEEQAQSIRQVTTGVDQISSVVQTNSATAEESAAASEELSGQAQMLKSLVSRFRLKNSGERYGNPAVKQYDSRKPALPQMSESGLSKY